MIGDVCGHGPDEAALGVELRIAWRALTFAGLCGDALLSTLQKVLENERSSEEIFATLCTVDIAADGRSAGVCLAGHPSPLFAGADADAAPRLLPEGENGPALGLLPQARWPRRQVRLGRSWSLMMYTDGLIEGRVHARPRGGAPHRFGLRRGHRIEPGAAGPAGDARHRGPSDGRGCTGRAAARRDDGRGARAQRGRADRRRGRPAAGPGPSGVVAPRPAGPGSLRRQALRLVAAVRRGYPWPWLDRHVPAPCAAPAGGVSRGSAAPIVLRISVRDPARHRTAAAAAGRPGTGRAGSSAGRAVTCR